MRFVFNRVWACEMLAMRVRTARTLLLNYNHLHTPGYFNLQDVDVTPFIANNL